MGLLKKVRKVAKQVAKPVTKVVQKATAKGPLKGSKLILRKTAAIAAPVVAPVALFVQPKVLGIKNQQNAKLFDKSQQVTRIVAAVAGTVATAGAIGVTAAGAQSAALASAKVVGAKVVAPMLLSKVTAAPRGPVDATVDDRASTGLGNTVADRVARLDATTQEKVNYLAARDQNMRAVAAPADMGGLSGSSAAPLLLVGLVGVALYLAVR